MKYSKGGALHYSVNLNLLFYFSTLEGSAVTQPLTFNQAQMLICSSQHVITLQTGSFNISWHSVYNPSMRSLQRERLGSPISVYCQMCWSKELSNRITTCTSSQLQGSDSVDSWSFSCPASLCMRRVKVASTFWGDGSPLESEGFS